MKKILIIGFGLSGRSAAAFMLSQSFDVTAVDVKQQELMKREDVQILIRQGVKLIRQEDVHLCYDLVICSPGISREHPLVIKLIQLGIEIIGEVELGFRYIKNPIVGVSGTNGKTTVTLLVQHILNYAGKKALALGNVGIPLTSALNCLDSEEIIVAELSSYQLEGLTTPLLDASVLLNITPDHLDRYGTMENYAAAKLNLQKITRNPLNFFIHEQALKYLDNPLASCYGYENVKGFSTDLKSIKFDGKSRCVLPIDLQNRKSHDLENFMAAFALCSIMNVEPDMIGNAYASFHKPEHRIEYVREIGGVKFYDDSKGTNIDAVMRAVEKMEGSVHLIAGGVDKGASYAPWIKSFGSHVKRIYAIGEAAIKIKSELERDFQVNICKDLESAVNTAFSYASPGENVLLSPGCSSFDMFIDYVERGKAFKGFVQNLNGFFNSSLFKCGIPEKEL